MKTPWHLVDKKGLSILLVSFAILTVIAMLAIVLGLSLRNRAALRTQEKKQRLEERILDGTTDFSIEDFYLYPWPLDKKNPYPTREARRYWTDEEVELYWINPQESSIDALKERNDQAISESLGLPYPWSEP